MAYISVLKLHPLFFKCHKILPLVYDESLSYYEVLCKVAKSVNEVIESTNQLNDNVTDLNSRTNQLTDKVNEIAEEINGFEAEINGKFDDLVIRIEGELGEKFEDYDRQFAELKADTQRELLDLQNEMDQFLTVTFPALEVEIRNIISEEIAQLATRFDSLESELKAYIYSELQRVLDEIPAITTVYIVDPFTGKLEDIQTVISHVYDIVRFYALTADEFDALGMNCDEIDHIEVDGIPRGLTCYEWDMFAKLYIKKKATTYSSYLTGEQVSLEDNVNINNCLLKESGCYECGEFDSIGGTVNDIDSFNITAFNWDWFSNNLYVA